MYYNGNHCNSNTSNAEAKHSSTEKKKKNCEHRNTISFQNLNHLRSNTTSASNVGSTAYELIYIFLLPSLPREGYTFAQYMYVHKEFQFQLPLYNNFTVAILFILSVGRRFGERDGKGFVAM